MQINRSKATMAGVVREILQSGKGVTAFWTGSFSLYLKLAPHTVIVLVLTDVFREKLGIPTIL